MTTTKFIVCIAVLVLGEATLGSSQWRRQNNYEFQQFHPQHHRPYQYQYPTGQTGVSVSDAEWVCKNPKTGDMMVIIAEDAVAGGGPGPWQHQHPPIGQPFQPGPNYPQQPNNPQPQPNYPQPLPTAPTAQPQPNYPQPIPTAPTTQPPIQGTSPNSNGEGVIDIRIGKK